MLFIGVLSAERYEDRREACRSTWFGKLQRMPGVIPVFLVGGYGGPEDWHLEGDTLKLKCPDTYPHLPQKTRLMCRAALEDFNATTVFKCDDDTYIQPDRLVSYSLSADYIGASPNGNQYGSGGAGYFLSRRAAQIVADHLTDPTGSEDLLVGEVLHQHGISFTADQERFQPWKGKVPLPGNTIITGHYQSPADMHALFSGQPPAPAIHYVAAPIRELQPTASTLWQRLQRWLSGS